MGKGRVRERSRAENREAGELVAALGPAAERGTREGGSGSWTEDWGVGGTCCNCRWGGKVPVRANGSFGAAMAVLFCAGDGNGLAVPDTVLLRSIGACTCEGAEVTIAEPPG